MNDKLLCNLRQDLREANQRYHKIAVTAGRYRKALEWYADPGIYLADGAGTMIATAWQGDRIADKAREALKRNNGFAVRYEDALKVAREALVDAEDQVEVVCCLTADTSQDCTDRKIDMDQAWGASDRLLKKLCQAINKINSILGGK